MNNLLFVFLGGGAGSLARYGISELVRKNFQGVLPLATLTSNSLSCLVLALSLVMLNDKMPSTPSMKLLLITGFCGGFSTFSTFSFETVGLLKAGYTGIALANIIISIGVCFAIVYFLSKNS